VKVYGCFAPALEDYNDYRIFQRINTPPGAALRLVVDPYAYVRRPRFRERLRLPKFLVNSSGDQFFVADAARFYWRRLPGQKHIRYVPNSDHTLSRSTTVLVDSLAGLLAWYRTVLLDIRRPPISWSFNEREALVVRTSSPGATARLWQATNASARDFRLESIGEAWTSSMLRKGADGTYRVRVPKPSSGWTAYFVEVTHPGVVAQIYSTQVFITPRPRPFEDVKLARADLCRR
jgi:PhoPQ-activated pathogenicity-related protein